jgi:16S rRNA G966 N2-methylase RsmD
MEKRIRICTILLFTVIFSLIIQYLIRNFVNSFLIISPLILLYYFILINLRDLIKSAIGNFEKVYDRIIGIDITKTESLEDLGISANKGYLYEATRKRHISPFLKKNSKLFNYNEKIIDLGCGKGSALIALKEAGFKNVSGIEISEKLCSIAKLNLQKIKLYDVNIINSDVLDFNQYEDFDIFYMFNPFPGEIIRNVMVKIELSLKNKPREVKIIYMNPKHHTEIENSKIFKKLGEFNYDSERSIYRKIFVYKN